MLSAVDVRPAFDPLPPEHRALAEAAEARAVALGAPGAEGRVPGLVGTSGRVGWAAVRMARGLVGRDGAGFCEWGSGLGLVTLLAERAGFDAWGIELEPVLVAEARRLAAAHGGRARFAVGSYKPEGFLAGETRAADLGPVEGLPLFGADVTFVFGWPAEVRAVSKMFADHAPEGALLLLYRGGADLTAWRQDRSPAASSAARPLR
ncbi:class I SAM-dependent methyltransferase [Oceaniglobus roseus]|uniref:class I SAM-dependent methyltransferase n=1 Tax=Oceaniglobus roseus TaxID=1737570 RepID=UPI000C7F3C90|nr:class I SAM-dependent methyltransferase [Kandeliimicrobium roseum]